jgi:hypothetical protein
MASLGKVLITAKSVSGSEASLARLRDAGCEVVLKSTPLPFDEQWIAAQGSATTPSTSRPARPVAFP